MSHCADLRVARERLCRAEVRVGHERLSGLLQEAIDRIDQVGVFCCADWSKYAWPTVEGDG